MAARREWQVKKLVYLTMGNMGRWVCSYIVGKELETGVGCERKGGREMT